MSMLWYQPLTRAVVGEQVGFEHYKLPLVSFLAYETLDSKLLSRCSDSLVDFWIGTLRRDGELDVILAYINRELSADDLLQQIRSTSRCPAEEASPSPSSSSQPPPPSPQRPEAAAAVEQPDENPGLSSAGEDTAHNLQADSDNDGNPVQQDEETAEDKTK